MNYSVNSMRCENIIKCRLIANICFNKWNSCVCNFLDTPQAFDISVYEIIDYDNVKIMCDKFYERMAANLAGAARNKDCFHNSMIK